MIGLDDQYHALRHGRRRERLLFTPDELTELASRAYSGIPFLLSISFGDRHFHKSYGRMRIGAPQFISTTLVTQPVGRGRSLQPCAPIQSHNEIKIESSFI